MPPEHSNYQSDNHSNIIRYIYSDNNCNIHAIDIGNSDWHIHSNQYANHINIHKSNNICHNYSYFYRDLVCDLHGDIYSYIHCNDDPARSRFAMSIVHGHGIGLFARRRQFGCKHSP